MEHSLIENKGIISALLVFMFFLSGINKMYSFNDTVYSVKNKIQFDVADELYNLVIILVILLEIIAPIIIIYNAVTGDRKLEAYYSVIGLIIFTIVATLLYHLPDIFSYKKSMPFWANVSLLGGLLLLLKTMNKEPTS